jgi:homoserine O-acetyltransferase
MLSLSKHPGVLRETVVARKNAGFFDSVPLRFISLRMTKKMIRAFCFAILLGIGGGICAAEYPAPTEGDYVIRDFKFTSGETMPELKIHYRTIGKAIKDDKGVVRNAVLITHGTTGSGAQFIRPEFGGELFGAGQPLDAAKFFIVLPDGIGHGKSSKPSDGMHAKFPRYGYVDMVEAQFRLLTDGLGVNHARLVMGTSMGGMHTWLWASAHPDFMDALLPLASLPTQISGRNRAWRRMIIDGIRHDPEWRGGDYSAQPQSLRTAAQMLWLMSSNPVLRQKEAPALAKSDEVLDKFVADYLKTGDANDMLYALEASRDYDPGPGLERIRAPLLAINSADDLINPPELGILEREIKRVPKGRAVVLPLSDKTRGHGSHTIATLWKNELEALLKQSEK